jgi:hypothetical protein
VFYLDKGPTPNLITYKITRLALIKQTASNGHKVWYIEGGEVVHDRIFLGRLMMVLVCLQSNVDESVG